jgi:hypothetical protein
LRGVYYLKRLVKLLPADFGDDDVHRVCTTAAKGKVVLLEREARRKA